MAITSAQLTGAITASQTIFGIQNINGTAFATIGAFPNPQQPILIDSEMMYLVTQPVAGTIQVRSRGAEGTAATSHDVLANVYSSTNPAVDFGNPGPGSFAFIDPSQDQMVSIGQSGTIPVPFGGNQIYNINASSAVTMTLGAPSLVANGATLIITSNTAFAHVLSAVGLINDGTASTPHNTVTFVARVGAGITLVAENGFWNVTAQQAVTVS